MNLEVLKRFLGFQLYNLKEENEIETYQEIKNGAIFKGFNLWILGFAMIIACIGLTTNSLSSIIGAMLISPLMGPVVGFAFGLSINDKSLVILSIKNWILMTLVSLGAATLYFLINPFGNSTEILESFKKATIFDILIAFFGGLAGFIGILKKEGTKIIAGVAIATACMPPLCTAAFGIAHFNVSFFLGGLYFYLINCVFIGWATYILSRYYKFKKNTSGSIYKINSMLWYVMLILIMLPGLYLAYTKWEMQKNAKPITSDKKDIELLEQRVRNLENILNH